MKAMETEKFKKFAPSFFLLLLGAGFGLPFLGSLLRELASGNFRWDAVLGLSIVFSIMAWIALLMMLAWGTLTPFLTKDAYNRVDSLPYQFKSEAISKADTFVQLLMAAKSRAEESI